jgi:hypothetical protein
MFSSTKHTSLLRQSLSYSSEKVCSIGPRVFEAKGLKVNVDILQISYFWVFSNIVENCCGATTLDLTTLRILGKIATTSKT